MEIPDKDLGELWREGIYNHQVEAIVLKKASRKESRLARAAEFSEEPLEF